MKKKSAVAKVVGYILYCLLFLFVSVMFVKSIRDCNEYKAIYKDAVVVSGVITAHDEYEDSEGDTDYYAYVSYKVDGKVYKNVQFQSTSTESKRLPLGEVVEVSLNPKNHGQLMKDVASSAVTVLFSIAFFALIFWGTSILIERKISSTLESVYDRDTVVKDVKLTLAAKIIRPTLLATSVCFMVLPDVYPMLFSGTFRFFSLIFFVVWSILVARVVRRAKKLSDDDFTIEKEVVLDLVANEDSDGNTYGAVISCRDGKRNKGISKKKYEEMFIGQTVYCVYLGKEKRPVITYNKF